MTTTTAQIDWRATLLTGRQEMNTPAIYVADLAAYNAGHLHGEWIKLDETTTPDELHEQVDAILAEGTRRYCRETLSVHEEFAIHDYECFGPISIGEYDSLETVLSHVERMGEEPAKYFAYIDAVGTHYANQYDPDTVEGPYDSEDDYAYQWLDAAIGTDDVVEWAREKGMPEALTYGLKFDPEAFLYALKCNSAISFGAYDGEVYAVEG